MSDRPYETIMADYSAVMPWLLARAPSGRVLHVLNRYRYTTLSGTQTHWWPACRPWGDGWVTHDGTLVSVCDAEGPVCAHCVRRVEEVTALAVRHRDRLRELANPLCPTCGVSGDCGESGAACSDFEFHGQGEH